MNAQYLKTYINERVQAIPSLPAVVGKILEITADPDSSTQELWKIIRSDQALSANLLKLANSAFYGLPQKVGSLQHALSLLGYKEIRNLVVTQAVFETFRDQCKYGPLDLAPYWAHAFTCAMGSQIISEYLGGDNQDLYTACLLHDIGKLVIYMALPEAYAEMVYEIGYCGYTIYETEHNFFGLTHEQTGQTILQNWFFPERIIQSIGCHHHPEKARGDLFMTWSVHVIDLLAHWAEAEDREYTNRCAQVEKELLRSEIVDLFGSAGRAWNLEAAKLCKQQLVALMTRQSDIMSIFFN